MALALPSIGGTAPAKKPTAAKKPVTAAAPAKKPAAAPASFAQTIPQSTAKVQMVGIRGGTFTMTDPKTGKPRAVTLKPFFLSKTEVTWEMFDVYALQLDLPEDKRNFPKGEDAILRPSKPYAPPDNGWGHDGYPAMRLTHNAAAKFCKWMAEKTGKKYRLPTEAEWEYACRAGTGPAGPVTNLDLLGKQAWFAGNAQEQTHAVAQKAANAWGLFDMLGNVAEWCTALSGDPVVRGGSFLDMGPKVFPGAREPYSPVWQENDPQFPKSEWWLTDGPHVGFRLACD